MDENDDIKTYYDSHKGNGDKEWDALSEDEKKTWEASHKTQYEDWKKDKDKDKNKDEEKAATGNDEETIVVNEGNVDSGEEKKLHPWMEPIDKKLKETDNGGIGTIADNGKDYIFTASDNKNAVQYVGPENGGETNSTHNPDKIKIQSQDYEFIRKVLEERKEKGGFKNISLAGIKTPEMAAMMIMAADSLGMQVKDDNPNFKIAQLEEKLKTNSNDYTEDASKAIAKEYGKYINFKDLEKRQKDSTKNLIEMAGKLRADTEKYTTGVVSNSSGRSGFRTAESGVEIFSTYQGLKEAAAGKAPDSDEKKAAEKYFQESIAPNIYEADGKTYKNNPLANYFKAQEEASKAYKELITTYIKDGKPYDGKDEAARKKDTIDRIDTDKTKSKSKNKETAYNILRKFAEGKGR